MSELKGIFGYEPPVNHAEAMTELSTLIFDEICSPEAVANRAKELVAAGLLTRDDVTQMIEERLRQTKGRRLSEPRLASGRLTAAFEVRAGIVPGHPLPEYTKHFWYTPADRESDEKLPPLPEGHIIDMNGPLDQPHMSMFTRRHMEKRCATILSWSIQAD